MFIKIFLHQKYSVVSPVLRYGVVLALVCASCIANLDSYDYCAYSLGDDVFDFNKKNFHHLYDYESFVVWDETSFTEECSLENDVLAKEVNQKSFKMELYKKLEANDSEEPIDLVISFIHSTITDAATVTSAYWSDINYLTTDEVSFQSACSFERNDWVVVWFINDQPLNLLLTPKRIKATLRESKVFQVSLYENEGTVVLPENDGSLRMLNQQLYSQMIDRQTNDDVEHFVYAVLMDTKDLIIYDFPMMLFEETICIE